MWTLVFVYVCRMCVVCVYVCVMNSLVKFILVLRLHWTLFSLSFLADLYRSGDHVKSRSYRRSGRAGIYLRSLGVIYAEIDSKFPREAGQRPFAKRNLVPNESI